MLDDVIIKNQLTADAVFGIYSASSKNETVNVEGHEFNFPRQLVDKGPNKINYSLADFISPDQDWIGMFAVTAGKGIEDVISKFEKERNSAVQVAAYQAATARFYSSVFNFPKPTIAYIQGYCIGGGMALAVACDLRLCEDKSRFAVPAAKLGLGYGFDGVARLSALVGPSMVKEIFFTARQFNAQEAYDMGLVNRVLPAHMLPAYAEDYSRRIAENAPLTVGSIKAITQDLQKPESERDLDRLAAMVKACFDSDDYKEGRKAFMEKRKPQFKGR